MDNPFEVIDHRFSRLEALLLEIVAQLRSSTTAGVPETGGLELAQEFTHLSKSRLYALVAARRIPHAKRGNRLYFTRAELQAWIAAGRRGSPAG